MKPVTSLADALSEILSMDAPLKQRLAAYVEAQVRLNSPFVAAYDRLVARLAKAGVGQGSPDIGDLMPPFALPDQNGRLVNLAGLTGAGPTVLSFNRGHWCPYCRIELKSHLEAEASLAGHGAKIVSIMPEPQTLTAPFARSLNEKLTVLSDIDNGFALSIGLLMWVGDEVIELMRARGLSLNEFQGNDGWFLPLPATFVLDRDGRILARSINPDFRTRMETDEILAALARSVD